MVAFHCVTCVGCTVYSRANCETVLSPTRASNPTLALKAALCRLRFAFISLLFLIYSRPTKVHLNPWSNFWGPPQTSLMHQRFSQPLVTDIFFLGFFRVPVALWLWPVNATK